MNEAFIPLESTSSRNEVGSIGLVVPLYKSWTHIEALSIFVNTLNAKIGGLVSLTIVVDGCPESELALRQNVKLFECPVRLVVLSRNFGVGSALRAAMSQQTEDFTIAFGSDLQEPEDLFIQFAKVLRAKEFEFVFGHRVTRDDPRLTRYFADIFWRLNRRFIFKDCPIGGIDVYGCSQLPREALVNLQEQKTNITSQMLWLGYRRKFIDFHRIARKGKSTWSFRKKLGLFIDSFVAFSSIPLKVGLSLISILPFVVTMSIQSASFKVGFIVLASICWSIGFLLLSLYLVRFFDGNRDRPTFVIQNVEHFNSQLSPKRISEVL
jgi:glycosyltransferase involved in cell wall biosynthesis